MGRSIQTALLSFIILLLINLSSCTNQSKSTLPSLEEKEEIVSFNKNRFEKDIANFEAVDKRRGYLKSGILFTGSSSIRMWTSLQQDFPQYQVINRGFGGATLTELNYFLPRILGQHKPETIVVYCGENDISENKTVSATYEEFIALIDQIQKLSPESQLIYISMKPSISRWALWPKFQKAEKLISDYIQNRTNAIYMDVSQTMLMNNQQVMTDIFIKDGLHMNEKGYEIWKNQLTDILNQD